MREGPPNNFEKGLESIPTPEDIRLIFEKILKGAEYETLRQLEDEQGLYLWEIRVSEESGYAEYSYMRKGRYKEGQASDNAIYVAFFNEKNIPVDGYDVAKYIDGEWKFTP